MKIAIEGCAHGELDRIYETLVHIMTTQNITIDLLICCGDFQCPRNTTDMGCMSMPEKFLSMGSFYKYYSGEKVAPVPTIFIHGNHECVNYLKELYLGGWVAPNIYYLGYAGVINFGGIRIGGMSGIWSEQDYKRGYYERPPYRGGASKSSYHVREYEVFKLSQIREPMDVFLSHDWPRGIYHFGDKARLIQKKPFFEAEIKRDDLGSVAAQHVLMALKPTYWFSAHLHVKFAALLEHPSLPNLVQPLEQATSSNMATAGNGMQDSAQVHANFAPKTTRFLALDKCLPGRDFLQILDIEPTDPQSPYAARNALGQYSFYYDAEWLAIVRASLPLYSTVYAPADLPATLDVATVRQQLLAEHRITSPESLRIPTNFEKNAPVYDPNNASADQGFRMFGPFENQQTRTMAETYGLTLPMSTPPQQGHASEVPPADFSNQHESNPDEIDLDDQFDES